MKKLLNLIWNGVSAISGLLVVIFSLGLPASFFKPILIFIGALVLGVNSVQLGMDIKKRIQAKKEGRELENTEEHDKIEQ
jgi:hypothetical protein